jgi:hypothetical protein
MKTVMTKNNIQIHDDDRPPCFDIIEGVAKRYGHKLPVSKYITHAGTYGMRCAICDTLISLDTHRMTYRIHSMNVWTNASSHSPSDFSLSTTTDSIDAFCSRLKVMR